jgi:hypothetical protein
MKQTEIDWHLGEIWNEAAFIEQKPLVKRDYVYASELGGSMVDRYLKMLAVPFTDPPNTRSLGKFLAGRMWEKSVKNVLKACGVYHRDEVKCNSSPYSDTLDVHGRCDFICGAFEIEFAQYQLDAIKDFIDEDLYHKGCGIIKRLGGKPLKTKGIELKSCSSYVYDRVVKTKRPIPIHAQQGNYYQRFLKIPFDVSYISKDDSFMVDSQIDSDKMEPLLRADLEKITYFLLKSIVPPEEPLMSFNPITGNFEKNIQIEYSPYISMRGFASPFDFRKAVEPTTKRWNNVLTRYAKIEGGAVTPTGKEMRISPQNKEVRQEIIASGYDFNELLQIKMQFLGQEDVSEEE